MEIIIKLYSEPESLTLYQFQGILNEAVYKIAFLIGCIHNLPLGFLKHLDINQEYASMIRIGLQACNEKIDKNNLLVGLDKLNPEINSVFQNLAEIQTINSLLQINYETYLLTNCDIPVEKIFPKIINSYVNNNEFSKVNNNSNVKYLIYGTAAFSLGAITAYCLIH